MRIYHTKQKVVKIDEKLHAKLEAYKAEDLKRGRPASIRMASVRLANDYDNMSYEMERVKKTFPLFKFRRVKEE